MVLKLHCLVILLSQLCSIFERHECCNQTPVQPLIVVVKVFESSCLMFSDPVMKLIVKYPSITVLCNNFAGGVPKSMLDLSGTHSGHVGDHSLPSARALMNGQMHSLKIYWYLLMLFTSLTGLVGVFLMRRDSQFPEFQPWLSSASKLGLIYLNSPQRGEESQLSASEKVNS